nr:MAG TPA: hypothetical protein [Caudoviricetes sp.]
MIRSIWRFRTSLEINPLFNPKSKILATFTEFQLVARIS